MNLGDTIQFITTMEQWSLENPGGQKGAQGGCGQRQLVEEEFTTL